MRTDISTKVKSITLLLSLIRAEVSGYGSVQGFLTVSMSPERPETGDTEKRHDAPKPPLVCQSHADPRWMSSLEQKLKCKRFSCVRVYGRVLYFRLITRGINKLKDLVLPCLRLHSKEIKYCPIAPLIVFVITASFHQIKKMTQWTNNNRTISNLFVSIQLRILHVWSIIQKAAVRKHFTCFSTSLASTWQYCAVYA